jgi:hypothetical protein
VQTARFEYFALHTELRRLLHMAMMEDEDLFAAHMATQNDWHLDGHLCVCSGLFRASEQHNLNVVLVQGLVF